MMILAHQRHGYGCEFFAMGFGAQISRNRQFANIKLIGSNLPAEGGDQRIHFDKIWFKCRGFYKPLFQCPIIALSARDK